MTDGPRSPVVGGIAAIVALVLVPAGATGQSNVLPTPTQTDTTKSTSKLSLARATTTKGFLDVLAPITTLASGRVSVDYRAAGQRTRFSVAVNSAEGHVRFRRRLPAAQARAGTGILTLTYPGGEETRPQTVRLRAASGPANLALTRPQIVDGRLQASGTISARARGVVRLQLEYQVFEMTKTELFKGTVANGSWRIDVPLTDQQKSEMEFRTGTVHSYVLFTGDLQRRMRGEMRSFEVLGDR